MQILKTFLFRAKIFIDPNVYIGEASSNNAPEGQDKSSSFTTEKTVWNFPPNVYKTRGTNKQIVDLIIY